MKSNVLCMQSEFMFNHCNVYVCVFRSETHTSWAKDEGIEECLKDRMVAEINVRSIHNYIVNFLFLVGCDVLFTTTMVITN